MIFESSQRSPKAINATAALDAAAGNTSSVESAGEGGNVAGLDHSVGQFSDYLIAKITLSRTNIETRACCVLQFTINTS